MTTSVPAGDRLRVLVVDDEPLGRERVLDLLANANVQVIGTAADGAEAVKAIHALRPDVVFLDVQMPRMSGLDVVRELGTAMPHTIFVTAFDQYAIQAFEHAAVDYLVKPFKDARFHDALMRARERVKSKTIVHLHEQLLSVMHSSDATGVAPAARPQPKYLDRIAVQMHGKVRVVQVGKIEHITASGPYVDLHVGSQRFTIRESMQNLEEKLDPEVFVRVHRSTIVRLDLIESLLRHEGSEYEVQLRDGHRLRVGRSRLDALEQRLGEIR